MKISANVFDTPVFISVINNQADVYLQSTGAHCCYFQDMQNRSVEYITTFLKCHWTLMEDAINTNGRFIDENWWQEFKNR